MLYFLQFLKKKIIFVPASAPLSGQVDVADVAKFLKKRLQVLSEKLRKNTLEMHLKANANHQPQ